MRFGFDCLVLRWVRSRAWSRAFRSRCRLSVLWWVAGLGGAGVAGLRGRGSRRGQVFRGGGSRRGPCSAVQVFVAGLRGQVFVVVVVGGGSRSSWTGTSSSWAVHVFVGRSSWPWCCGIGRSYEINMEIVMK